MCSKRNKTLRMFVIFKLFGAVTSSFLPQSATYSQVRLKKILKGCLWYKNEPIYDLRRLRIEASSSAGQAGPKEML